MNLDLYLGGRHVGKTAPRSRGKKFAIEYTEAALDGTPDESILLSCSLPTPGPSGPMVARAYLEGLLPEGQALETMAARVREAQLAADGSPAEPADVIKLLDTYGRECAGAVTVVREGENLPGEGSYRHLSRPQVGGLIADLPGRPLGADPAANIRMSLAGNQPKLLLARFGEAWYEAVGGSATTHIIKPTGAWPLSADNEAIVMRLARTVGLTDAATWVEDFGGARALVAERFDRIVDHASKTVQRRHQEDMCQALGLRPREKYQIGRPSEKMARLLRQVPTAPGTDARKLFQQVAFRAIVGDEDGHGKNYGLIIEQGEVRLSPLYDSLTTLVYPRLTGNMGAQIGRQQHLARVDLASLVEEGMACGITEEESKRITLDLADDIGWAVIQPRGADVDAHALDVVTRTISTRVDRLIRGDAMGTAPAGTALMTSNGPTGMTMDQATRTRTSRALPDI